MESCKKCKATFEAELHTKRLAREKCHRLGFEWPIKYFFCPECFTAHVRMRDTREYKMVLLPRSNET